MRRIAVILGILFLTAPAMAGPNDEASLAMHTVASLEYLYCPDLTFPYGIICLDIDNSAEPGELDPYYGYVYVVFLAYDIYPSALGGGISGVEYCIAGWPTSRGAPSKPTLYYCPGSSLVLGDPFEGGGVQAFGETFAAPPGVCPGSVGFAYFGWASLPYQDFLPITLEYCASGYSYPADPHNYVLGPPPEFTEDPVVAAFGCTIGGTYHTPVPYWNCYSGCTPTDPTSWGHVKAMYR